MTDAINLIERCRDLGATLTLLNDRIRVNAPQPLPLEILDELRQFKPQILEALRYQSKEQATCWFLEEWRRMSIPEWRNILKQSVVSNDRNREKYARWMLKEILDDTEYKENNL